MRTQDIYERLASKVYRYAMSKLNNSADAEDVTSETFRRMLEQDKQDVHSWEAWLIGMARNVINEKYRDRKKENLQLNIDESTAGISLDKQPEFLLSLNAELENLESETREIIILKTWEELKFDEIAEVMSLNVNNVKAKYYRGIDELKMKLNSEDKDKKVRSVALPVILLGIAQLAKANVLAPSPGFLGKLWEKIGAEFSNLNINYQEMSKNSIKQLLTRKLFLAAAITTVVMVGGIAGITLLVVNNNSSVEPDAQQPSDELPTEPVLVPDEPVANMPQLPAGWTWSRYEKCDMAVPTPPNAAPYAENGKYWHFDEAINGGEDSSGWLAYIPDNFAGDGFPIVSFACEPNTESKTLADLEAEVKAYSTPAALDYYQTQKWGRDVVYAKLTGYDTTYSYRFIDNGKIYYVSIGGEKTGYPENPGTYTQPDQAQVDIMNLMWFNASDYEIQASTITPIDNTWSLYTNYKYGFSMKIPKQSMQMYGAMCNWVDNSYRPQNGIVPVKVFESETIYITSEYFYHLAGKTTTSDGYSNFSQCEKVLSSLADTANNTYFEQTSWRIVAQDVHNDAELDAFIKSRYGNGCSVAEKQTTDQAGVYDVIVQSDGKDIMETECLVNFLTVVKYSTELNRVVAWDLGQAYTFYAGFENPYDELMVDSFQFI